jgi:GntR family transcriptional regulator/MocR family aminotransferase
MPKRAASFELILPVRDRGELAYRWLYRALRAEILEGRLRPGTRLPGTRDLGGQYGLSRGTVVNAFGQLQSEGYVEGSVGSGTYVSQTLPEELQVKRVAPGPQPVPSAPRRKLAAYGRRVAPFSNLEVRPSRAFRPNLPALDLFPLALWAQVTARRLRRASTSLLLGCDPMGYLPLREAVADYLNASRGVKCAPAQVAIVSGVQEALDLAARLFLNPGDRVCMEDPGYTGASIVFSAFGARIAREPVDDEGMVVRAAGLRGSRLVYVTPAHQFPLGTTMSLSRRLALLEWARTAGAVIFEDLKEVYAERLSVLVEGARERLAGLLDLSTVEAGLQTAGWLRAGVSGERVAQAAAARGVEVTPLSRYRLGPPGREGLQLGFAAVDAREIRRGVRALAIALEEEGPG